MCIYLMIRINFWNISIINGVTVVDISNGETYILELNYAMDFTITMANSLLCPNQARHNNVIINDVPRCYDSKSGFNIFFLDSNIKWSNYLFKYKIINKL